LTSTVSNSSWSCCNIIFTKTPKFAVAAGFSLRCKKFAQFIAWDKAHDYHEFGELRNKAILNS